MPKVTKKGRRAPRRTYRLYVWKNVLTDYSAGIAVAAGRDEAEARAAVLVAAKEDCQLSTLAGQILRSPDAVLDLPAAAYVCGGG